VRGHWGAVTEVLDIQGWESVGGETDTERRRQCAAVKWGARKDRERERWSGMMGEAEEQSDMSTFCLSCLGSRKKASFQRRENQWREY